MFSFESVHNRKSSNFQLPLSLYFLCSWCILSLLFLKKHSNIFLPFLPIFWVLKPNLTKYEIAGLAALKGVEQTVYGMKCEKDWESETFKILSALFSYNETLRNFQYNYWYGKSFKMRNSALEVKILVFTSFVLSKITFHFYMPKVPNKVVREFQST